MKRLILVLSVVFAALAGFSAEAQLSFKRGAGPNLDRMGPTTPVSLNLVTPVGLPWGMNWAVSGFQIGLWNGLDDVDGLQIGVINASDRFRGLQFGVINVTRQMEGVQIGFINVINESDLVFFPVINAKF